jgi:bacteriocin-like protein
MSDPKKPEDVTEVSDVELSEDELDQISGGVGKITRRPSGFLKIGDIVKEGFDTKIPDLKNGKIESLK